MVDQIVLTLLHARRRAEIHPVLLTHVLDLLPRAGETDDVLVEFREVFGEHGGGVARWVAGYEDGEERREGG